MKFKRKKRLHTHTHTQVSTAATTMRESLALAAIRQFVKVTPWARQRGHQMCNTKVCACAQQSHTHMCAAFTVDLAASHVGAIAERGVAGPLLLPVSWLSGDTGKVIQLHCMRHVTCMYIYMCVCMCVCMCVEFLFKNKVVGNVWEVFGRLLI